MSAWGRVFAALYDPMLAGAERSGLGELRTELLSDLSGRVLELGAGTGVNIEHYPPSVGELVLTEPEEPMARRLEAKLAASGRNATVVPTQAESLPFDDASFDFVVSTLVLCTVRDLDASLAQARRVLKPGGELRFIEHVRSPDARLARWQDRVNPVWHPIGSGCNCNRDTPAAIEHAGFSIVRLTRGKLPRGLPHIRPLIVGSAA